AGAEALFEILNVDRGRVHGGLFLESALPGPGRVVLKSKAPFRVVRKGARCLATLLPVYRRSSSTPTHVAAVSCIIVETGKERCVIWPRCELIRELSSVKEPLGMSQRHWGYRFDGYEHGLNGS